MTHNLDYALRTIKSTMYLHKNSAYFPYFFIVGAGISVPEIPSASGIVDICKNTVLEMDPELFSHYDKASKDFSGNGMKYYSSWIEYAYPNRINRSHLFKELCSKSKISSANLMLAQILNSNEFANTVFTTNFDDSIKKALELMGTKNFFCAENIMDNLVISNQTKDIQVIHVHGTFNFYDCANLEKEIDNVATQSGTISSAQLLSSFLSNQAPIIVGYSGWENDVIMRCLKERLAYPTPLQYIWICYSKQSYINLPNWIKNSDSVIFVIPESESGECEESCDTHSWDNSSNIDKIDATMFFKRIISTFKLKPPLIFTDPHLYYSRKIKSILPKNEDVLHLRHWTQRLKILESDDTFEKLVQNMEALYIAKDYVEATKVLNEMCNLSLNEANAEFVCTSLIKEFIHDEDIIPSFEDRLNFHLASLQFIEKNLPQLNNSKSLISTLRSILFTRFRYSNKEKVFELFDKVINLAQKDSRLLLIELTAIGTKSGFMEKETKVLMLQDILSRCPENSDNKDFIFLRFRALCELSKTICSEDAISLIEEAEHLIPSLNNDAYTTSLCLAKSEIIPYVTKVDIKEKWLKEILDLLFNADDVEASDQYIEITANLASLPKELICKSTSPTQVETVVGKLLSENCLDLSKCHSILQYCQCCELVCKVSDDNSCISKYCGYVFDTISSFHQSCNAFLSLISRITEIYLLLPLHIVDENSKINAMLKIKQNEHISGIYYNLLSFAFEKKIIGKTAELTSDIEYIENQQKLVIDGYNLYCDGHHKEAEDLFLEASSCQVPHIADSARTNLAYMVRRNETKSKHSFESIIQEITYLSGLDIINILLYYDAQEDTTNVHYVKAKSNLKHITKDDRDSIISWWSNTELVGEKESEHVLSLINNS